MTDFVVTIECIERYTYETRAYNEEHAISKAFENSGAWRGGNYANDFKVSVRMEGDEE